MAKEVSRDKIIIRTSIIGILANIFLAAFKAGVGILSHSIAIVLDAVNNLSDAMSSVITIVGTKLAGKQPDKKHPLGYGRIEYLSATIISLIVLYAGITSFVESIKKILQPEKADYGTITLVIVAVAVVVKLILGRYVKGIGEEVKSDSLIASGSDAMLDSIISASTLFAALIYLGTGISLEAWLGALISVIIMKSGFEMLRDTISQILGERVSGKFTKEIKATICTLPNISGAYDLILHNYGPDRYVGSVHIEIPDTLTAREIDELMRDVQHLVYEKHGVILEGISIYSVNSRDDKAQEMLTEIRHLVMSHDHVLQMHGFYVHEKEKYIGFDVIIDFGLKDRQALFEHIENDVHKMYPEYELRLNMDADITD